MPSIRRQNAYAKNAYTYYPIVIVGAGESGIAMGCQLKQVLGFDQFRIFERQSGIGGTWWINRYPGVACDIPAIFYSFSFAQNPNWTSMHPPGPEIARYLADVCAKYEIVDKIQLHTEVTELKWLEDEEEWEIRLAYLRPGTGDWSELERREKVAAEGERSVYIATEIVRCKIAISAVGGLVEPKVFPKEIPGIETFQGDVIHSAKWRDDIDFTGKDVVVLGTGASGAQVVSAMSKEPYKVKSITQLMRTPPWVRPFGDDPESGRIYRKYVSVLLRKIPGMTQTFRFILFLMIEHEFFSIFADTDYTRKHLSGEEEACRRYMKKMAPEKYFDMLTPDYRLGCKRRIIGGDWYKSLHDTKVELTTRRLKSIQARGVTLGCHLYPKPAHGTDPSDEEDVELAADAIIVANGYHTNEWLHPMRVIGRNGYSLHDVWDERGGPQAYLGIAMDKFPNFFMIFGPNTATGHSSVVLATENAVQYSLKFIKSILDGTVSTWEVKEEAEREWTEKVQRGLKGTTFSSGCSSWYTQENGWNSTTYPFSQIDYGLRCMFPVWGHWDAKFTPGGIRRRRLRALTRGLSLMAVVSLYIWWKKRPGAFQALKAAILQAANQVVGSVVANLQRLQA